MKEAYKEAVEHPLSEEIRSLVGEYGFVMKQFLQLKDEKEIMLSQARMYLDEQVEETTDARYGPGFADFLHRAIEAFYER